MFCQKQNDKNFKKLIKNNKTKKNKKKKINSKETLLVKKKCHLPIEKTHSVTATGLKPRTT